MQIKQRFWKRSGYVAIEMENGRFQKFGGDNDSLDFKFEGVKLGDICNDFTVSILGLSTDTINTLTVWDLARAIKRRRKIRVYAGYSTDSIASPIFEGIVMEAIPSPPPNKWLSFKCMYIGPQPEPGIATQYVEGKIEKVFKQLVKNVNLTYENKTTTESYVPMWKVTSVDKNQTVKFKIDKSPMANLSDFANTFGIKCYCEGVCIYAVDAKGWYKTPHDAKVISVDTGLIDIPFIDLAGAKIKLRLSDDIALFSWVYLKSELIPSANGYYYAIEKKQVGHFRGDDWYTEITTMRAVSK